MEMRPLPRDRPILPNTHACCSLRGSSECQEQLGRGMGDGDGGGMGAALPCMHASATGLCLVQGQRRGAHG